MGWKIEFVNALDLGVMWGFFWEDSDGRGNFLLGKKQRKKFGGRENEQLGKIRRAVLQTLTEFSLPFIRSCEATLLLSV